jgi:alkylation response protein AidB-like acyl-CoA dehydrogenase
VNEGPLNFSLNRRGNGLCSCRPGDKSQRHVISLRICGNAQVKTPALHYSIASKILAAETTFRIASMAIQIFGGSGLSKDFVIEKIFRDARTSTIEDGVNETLALAGVEIFRAD